MARLRPRQRSPELRKAMRRRSRASQPAKARRRKAEGSKRRSAAAARVSSSHGGQETKVARLTRELNEALDRQAATAEILRLISSSPTGVQPVFDTIVRNFVSLCGSVFGSIYTFDGELVHFAGSYGFSPKQLQAIRTKYPVRVDDRSVLSSRAILAKAPLHIQDTESDPDYDRAHAAAVLTGRLLAVPMLRDGVPLGAIVAGWPEPGAIPKHHEDLLKVFADQAVIAIENARLLNELRQRTSDLTESLEQQTATSEVLKVISRSAFDLQTVLNTLTGSATQLCAADRGVIFLRDGDVYRVKAIYGFSPEGVQYAQEIRPGRSSVTGRVALEGRAIHIHDVLADPEYEPTGYQKSFGFRTNLGVPLLRDGTTIGVFALNRDKVKPFTDKQIELVTTFADQAVIAIENARLLNELRQSLEQQTTTAEILGVISKSLSDTQPVFESIVRSGVALFSEAAVCIALVDNGMVRAAAVADRDLARAEAFRSVFHS